jgi:microcystin-dependent protein
MASEALDKGALWMQNVDYPASWDRILIDSLYADQGVIDGFAVTPAGDLDISISGGRAIVEGEEVAGQGKYLIDQDAAITLTLASVGAARTEYVFLAVNDTAVSGGRPGNNVTIETSTTAPGDSTLLLATLTLPLGASTITSGMIADNRVYADVVAPDSVTNAKLADGSVVGAVIADSAVTAAKIASGAVVAAKIGTGAVTTTKIDDGAVTTAKLADESVTLAKLSSTITALIEAIDPADKIIAIGGAAAPTGWGLCDGSAVSRTTFAATFARIGITHGAGDGSTTFNVPDLRNRFIAGKGTTAWSDTVGEVGGTKDLGLIQHAHGTTVSASGTQPSHTHPGTTLTGSTTTDPGNHEHDFGGGMLYNSAVPSGFGLTSDAGAGVRTTAPVPEGSHGHNVSVSGNTAASSNDSVTVTVGVTVGNVTGVTVVDGTDDNLPPYRVLNYCIRLR